MSHTQYKLYIRADIKRPKDFHVTVECARVCVLSLSLLVPTNFTLLCYCSSTINQSTTCDFKTRRPVFPYSLPSLVYYVHKILNNYYCSSIKTVCVLSLSLLVPTNFALKYSVSSTINLSITFGSKTRRTVVPYTLPTVLL